MQFVADDVRWTAGVGGRNEYACRSGVGQSSLLQSGDVRQRCALRQRRDDDNTADNDHTQLQQRAAGRPATTTTHHVRLRVPGTHVHRWRRGVVVSGVRRMNEVNAHRARLVPGWVTVFGREYHLDV